MVYLYLADGFEIVEAMAPVDVLRRAKIDVCTVGINSKKIESSCGICVEADISEEEFKFNDIQAIILPGGMPGTINLENSLLVQHVIDYAVQNNLLICAICAAPSILGKKGLLQNKEAICYPGFESCLEGARLSEDYVVTDGNYITARGAGVAVDFGLAIIKKLLSENDALAVKRSIQCK